MNRTHIAQALFLVWTTVRRSRTRAVLVATLVASGCSWGEDGLARLEQLNPTLEAGTDAGVSAGSDGGGPACQMPDDESGTPTPPADGCLGLLSGQWAVRLVEFDNISPLGPPAWDLTITDLFLAELSSDKSSLSLTFCGEENGLTDSTGATETTGQNIVPSTLVNALAQTPLAVPLPGDGTIQASGVVWLWGIQGLANPATDTLPTQADAGSVWDQDGDGNPGVTVDVVSPQGEITSSSERPSTSRRGRSRRAGRPGR